MAGSRGSARLFRLFSAVLAVLLIAGEAARWWGDPRFLPLALDELLIGAVLIAGALAARLGPLLLLIGWALLAGHTLGLLIPTLDHLLSGPPKDSASFYATLLSAMLAVEIAALLFSVVHLHRASHRL